MGECVKGEFLGHCSVKACVPRRRKLAVPKITTSFLIRDDIMTASEVHTKLTTSEHLRSNKRADQSVKVSSVNSDLNRYCTGHSKTHFQPTSLTHRTAESANPFPSTKRECPEHIGENFFRNTKTHEKRQSFNSFRNPQRSSQKKSRQSGPPQHEIRRLEGVPNRKPPSRNSPIPPTKSETRVSLQTTDQLATAQLATDQLASMSRKLSTHDKFLIVREVEAPVRVPNSATTVT